MEPLIHYLIPLVFILAFAPNLNKKLVFLLSPLLILPDIDFLFKAKMFHNIFFILIISFAVYFLYSWFIKKDKKTFYLAFFYLNVHLLFDFGGPGIPYFYPLSNKLFSLNFMIATSPTARIGTITQTTTTLATKTLAEASKDQIAPIITTPGIIFLLLTLSSIIALIIIKFYKHK